MRSSATIACRALVMLGCLVIIPLAAVSGSSLTEWVDTALATKWPWTDLFASASQSDPQFEPMPPDEAIWPSNLRPPDRVACPTEPHTADATCARCFQDPGNTVGAPGPGQAVAGQEPTQPGQAASSAANSGHSFVVPAGWDAPVACSEGVCRLGEGIAAPGTPEDPWARTLVATSDRQSATPSPCGEQSALARPRADASLPDQSVAARSLVSSGAGQPSEAGWPGAAIRRVEASPRLTTIGQEHFACLEQRLQQLGATYYLLEHCGNNQYRFFCRMATPGDPRLTQDFQQIDPDPLRAMSRVVEQVELWWAGGP